MFYSYLFCRIRVLNAFIKAYFIHRAATQALFDSFGHQQRNSPHERVKIRRHTQLSKCCKFKQNHCIRSNLWVKRSQRFNFNFLINKSIIPVNCRAIKWKLI